MQFLKVFYIVALIVVEAPVENWLQISLRVAYRPVHSWHEVKDVIYVALFSACVRALAREVMYEFK